MLLSAELFIELYKQSKKSDDEKVIKEKLKDYDLSPEQWEHYYDFIDDLDLNEDGIRIMVDEINNGHMKLWTRLPNFKRTGNRHPARADLLFFYIADRNACPAGSIDGGLKTRVVIDRIQKIPYPSPWAGDIMRGDHSARFHPG